MNAFSLFVVQGANSTHRFNPFNRQATLDIPNADVIESESIWAKIMRFAMAFRICYG